MTARVAIDRSREATQDRLRQAEREFHDTPSEANAEIYRQRAFWAWKAFNGSSVGWDARLARMDAQIAQEIAAAEAKNGGRA